MSEHAALGARRYALMSEGFSFSGYERDELWMHRGGGYERVSGVSGIDALGDARGAALADLDDDGDLDVVLRQFALDHQRTLHVFRNETGAQKGFVRITLEGRKSGRDAFGAEVRLGLAGGAVLTRVKASSEGFLAQWDRRLLFGIGDHPGAEWLEVRWPSGLRERFGAVEAGKQLHVVEGEGRVTELNLTARALPEPATREQRLWRGLGLTRGEPLPELLVWNDEGRGQQLRDLLPKGRKTIVNFWATWCEACGEEMPALQALHARPGDAHPAVIGVSLDESDTQAYVPMFLKRLGISYPSHLAASGRFEQAFGAAPEQLPITLLIDASGRVQEVVAGASRASRAVLVRWSE